MPRRPRLSAMLVLAAASAALAQTPPASVYAPPDLPSADSNDEDGGLHFGLGVAYFTDYVYRGVERFEVQSTNEDSLNLQVNAKLAVDLGKLPHPYVSIFSNVADSDPVNSFQEVRPGAGFDWTIKPVVFTAGYTAYLYPERSPLQTNEVFVQWALDSKTLYHGEAIPTPYVLAAYDYDKYDGFYLEAGVRYRLALDEIGLTLTASAEVAYVTHWRTDVGDGTDGDGFFTTAKTTGNRVDGFQHYQLGLVGEYSISKLFNVPPRYGDVSIRGYVYYTDGLSDEAAATTQVWGGAGLNLEF